MAGQTGQKSCLFSKDCHSTLCVSFCSDAKEASNCRRQQSNTAHEDGRTMYKMARLADGASASRQLTTHYTPDTPTKDGTCQGLTTS